MPHKEQQFLVHIILYNILSSFEAKKYQLLVLVKPTPRAVVSPSQTLRFEERETSASNRLLFHRACAST